MGRKRKVELQQTEALEAVAAVEQPKSPEPTAKLLSRKGRKAQVSSKASPRKKTKAVVSDLALFSDIDGGDLPELKSVETLESPSSRKAVKTPEVESLETAAKGPSESKNEEASSDANKQRESKGAPQSARRGRKSTFNLDGAEIRPLNPEVTATGFEVNEHIQDLSVDQCKKVYECNHCRRVYFNMYTLRMHIRQQHTTGGRKVRCPHCKFVFLKLSGLREHLARGRCEEVKLAAEKKKAKEKEKNNKTDDSDAGSEDDDDNSASGKGDKAARMNYHMAQKIFEPLIKRAMCLVEKKDAEPKPPGARKKPPPSREVYKCDMCPGSYEQRDSLRRHYKQVHIYLTKEQIKAKMKAVKPPPLVFKCPVPTCQKINPSKKQFKHHYKTAHAELFNELVESHMRGMDESVLYECHTCHKSYFLEASYLKHREECGDMEEDDGYEVGEDYDLLNEPWIEPRDDPPTKRRGGRKPGSGHADPVTVSDASDNQCRYCGKLFFTAYGRIDHERKHARDDVKVIEEDPAEAAEEDDANASEQPEKVDGEESRDSEPVVPAAPIKVEGPIMIRCLDCNKMFSSFDALERHHQAMHVQKGTSLLRAQLKA